MRILAIALLIMVGGVLVYGAADLPARGEPDLPLHNRVVAEYIARAEADTHTPNVVTAILADYRGYDTLGEVTVVFVAGAAVAFILGKGGGQRE